jgi:quinol-cytochrome oxidoreductase complex cytochrome b subunit
MLKSMNHSGLKNLYQNFLEIKQNFFLLMQRKFQKPESERDRSRKFSRNFFLHIHAARIHKYSLKPTYTLGLGLIAFYLFIIEIITGILLMLYYTPSIERAYASIEDITYVVIAGGFIRNMHRWAAHGMVLVVILHMARVFYTGAYLKGRSFNWLIGIALLLITLLLSFSGYLLPWDQLAYWAVTIGANIAGSATDLTDILGITRIFDPGGFIKLLLLGADSVGQDALIRFYLLHIVFLPLIGAVLVGVHFWRIRKDGGLSRPENASEILVREESDLQEDLSNSNSIPLLENETRQMILSWPVALWAEAAVLMLTLATLTLVSYLFDAPLKDIANPAVPDNPAKSPWYFLSLQELVSFSAFSGGIAIPTLVILALVSFPYLDREDHNIGLWFSGKMGKQITKNSIIYSVGLTILILVLVIQLGWLKNWFPGMPQIMIIFINPGTLITVLYAAWSVYILKKSNSTRLAAIALFSCMLVGFFILTILGLWFRGPNWEFFWSPAQWPVH